MSKRLALSLAAVLGSLLVGCAPNHGDAYPRAFAQAERAETAGRFREASSDYDAAAKSAIRDRDREHAQYLAGIMLLRAGDVRDGVGRLGTIAEASPPLEESPDAAYRVATSRIDSGDARGWSDLARVFARFPATGVGHVAFKRTAAHVEETQGKRAAYDYLNSLAQSPLGQTELGEDVTYTAAEELAAQEDYARAHDEFLATATRFPYPAGALWDDSLFRASEMDEKLGRFPHAVADLERMLAEREVSSITGSYQRPRMTPALMRIAMLYAVDLHDNVRARAALQRFYDQLDTSRARPTALWLQAELWREDGDAGKSCERLQKLVKEFPDSRYVPCAKTTCETITMPDKSEAPKWCHPYLMRPHRFSTD